MIDLPPRTSTERIDALCAEVKRQAEQLRIAGDLLADALERIAALEAERRPARDADFTCREKDVRDALLTGCTTRKAIADRLFLSERTVACYLDRMFCKTGTKSTVDLVVWLMGQDDATRTQDAQDVAQGVRAPDSTL